MVIGPIDESSSRPQEAGAGDGSADDEARLFYERLEQNGQLVNVRPGTDTATLPARVTHVRWPDGRVERIRIT